MCINIYKVYYVEYCGTQIKFHRMTCEGYKTDEGKYVQFWFYWFKTKLVHTRWFIDGVEQYEFKK